MSSLPNMFRNRIFYFGIELCWIFICGSKVLVCMCFCVTYYKTKSGPGMVPLVVTLFNRWPVDEVCYDGIAVWAQNITIQCWLRLSVVFQMHFAPSIPSLWYLPGSSESFIDIFYTLHDVTILSLTNYDIIFLKSWK